MKNKYAVAVAVGIILLASNILMGFVLDAALPSLKAEYETPAFRPWSDPIMSLFFAYPVVLGVLLSYVWFITRKSWKSGLEFGIAFGLLMSVPMFIVNYSSFTFSTLMVGTWALMNFVNMIVAGLALERLDG